MSLWTSSIITLLLLQFVPSTAQPGNVDGKPPAIEEVAAHSENLPVRPVIAKKDSYITEAYIDVFKILSNQNACSNFYGGPRAATTVLNSLVTHLKSEPLFREVAFRMTGKSRLIRDHSAGVLYRLFDKTTVNTNGAFYRRRMEAMRPSPPDVGTFTPGSRPARALILLHELGHLIEGKNGTWLLPNDGHDGEQSRANTLRVQQVCRAELKALE